jgi:hypothetical protein
MSSSDYLPITLTSFYGRVTRWDFPKLVSWCRWLGILPTTAVCPICKTETELEIPDKEDSKNIHTKCSNPMCARKSNHRRTLWFKTRSIFAHTYKPIALVLLVIFCFVGLLDAQHTARECGMCEEDMERGHTRHDPRNIAHDTVSKLFARMRNAVTWWGDNHHRYVCVYVCVCV